MPYSISNTGVYRSLVQHVCEQFAEKSLDDEYIHRLLLSFDRNTERS